MKSRSFLTATLITLAAVSSAQSLYGVMYRMGGQTSGLNPTLYDVNPQTGAATNGRAVNLNDCVGVAFGASGAMYGMTDHLGRINNVSGQGGKDLLVKIDPATGVATSVGRVTQNYTDDTLDMYEGDLAYNPVTGVLWGLSTRVNSGRLFTIDTATGAGTYRSSVLPFGGNTTLDMSAMAFSATGDLWTLDTTYPDASQGPARLSRVDPATGAVLQSFVTSTNLGNVAGMTFSPNGTLLVADGDTGGTNVLYRVAFSGTAASLVAIGATGAAGGAYQGLSGLAYSPAPVPEPAPAAALALGGLAMVRRRRAKV